MKSTRNTFLRSVAGTGAEDMSVTESRYKSSKAIDYGRQSRAVDIQIYTVEAKAQLVKAQANTYALGSPRV